MSSRSVRLAIVFDSLTGGGAARVATTLANELQATARARVHVLLIDDGLGDAAFPIDAGISRYHLGLQRDSNNPLQALYHNVGRIRMLRRTLSKIRPDVIISFLDRTNVLVLLAGQGLDIPIIVSERTDPAKRKIGVIWECLRSATYGSADALVCQGTRPLRYFRKGLHRKAHIIPNPVTLPTGWHRLQSAPVETGCANILIALGSLRLEKGFDLLLEAFARIAQKHATWRLQIWGAGPTREELQAQAERLNLGRQVDFRGVTREPIKALQSADLFVLSSRVEGFPNCLAEAMAVGLAAVATDVGAVPEIIRHGYDGVIVPPNDVEALADGLDRLMSDRAERRRLGTRAPEVLQRFSLGKIVGMWDELIREVLGRRG